MRTALRCWRFSNPYNRMNPTSNQHKGHKGKFARGHSARRRRDHSQELAQDYVEMIADLIARTGEARLIDLARGLGVTHVTAARTLQRLQREGLVTTRPYRSIFLTPAGASLARESRARHELVFRFLTAIGVPASVAESDAEGIEHHVSRETLAAFTRHLRSGRTPRILNS
jgi:DtxR family transcriptional regulator, manganese transport regulator